MTLTQQALSGLAIASLATAPALAEVSRTAGPATETSEIGGGMEGGGWIAVLGVIAVVILAVLAASDDNDDAVSA